MASILLTGCVDNEEMLSYYACSSVYLLEAMACGLPMLCTDIPQNVPIIKAEGIVMQKKDKEGVATTLEKIFNNIGLCEALRLSGRKCIEDGYSLLTMNQKTIELYSEVLATPK